MDAAIVEEERRERKKRESEKDRERELHLCSSAVFWSRDTVVDEWTSH